MGHRLKGLLKKPFSFFIELISFSSPRAIVINISSIFAVLFFMPTSELNYLPIRCVFKNFILPLVYKGNCPTSGLFAGCECPFCGLTRAMSRLLHFDLKEALEFNILVIPVFIAMMVLLSINVFKLVKNRIKD